MKKILFFLASFAAVVLFLPSVALAWGHCFGGPMACGPMMAPPCGAAHIAPLLIALAAGYGVVVLAVRQTRKLSIFGLILGWFILAVSAVGIGCIAGRSLCWRFHRAQDVSAPAAACPYLSGAPSGAQAAPGKPAIPAPSERKK